MHGNWHHSWHGDCIYAVSNWLLVPATNNEISVILKISMVFCRRDNYFLFCHSTTYHSHSFLSKDKQLYDVTTINESHNWLCVHITNYWVNTFTSFYKLWFELHIYIYTWFWFLKCVLFVGVMFLETCSSFKGDGGGGGWEKEKKGRKKKVQDTVLSISEVTVVDNN